MTQQILLNPRSVVLASGGARGITAKCVIKLAQQNPANYILLGRSAIDNPMPKWAENCPDDAELKRHIMQDLNGQNKTPTPKKVQNIFKMIRSQQEVEDTLEQIRQTGSKVTYVRVDITDAEKMKAELPGIILNFGKITGIIHGAGALADRRIEKKTEKDYNMVIKPKVDGLMNLYALAPVKTLDFLVLFSSIVGIYGNIGQTDYALANEVLNKAAFHAKRENPKCRVVSINWGPWDSGMVTPQLKQAFAARNMALIPSDLGAERMVTELLSPEKIEDDPVQILFGAIPYRPAGQLSPGLNVQLISRRLSLDANPFLHDHKIGEHPVLPATCAASWIASICEQRFPGYKFFRMDNFKVLKGIVFEDSLAHEHMLELTELEKKSEVSIRCAVKIFSQHNNGKPLFHYQADVLLLNQLPENPLHDLPVHLNNFKQDELQSLTLYEDGTLFHGPSFQGVKQVLDISEERILLKCCLPYFSTKDQGQFPVDTQNPYLNDAIVQSLLIWTQHFLQTPCLPSRLKRLEQYQAPLFDQTYLVELQIVSQTDTSVVADLFVVDESGKLIVKLTELQGTISPLLRRFIGRKHNKDVWTEDG